MTSAGDSELDGVPEAEGGSSQDIPLAIVRSEQEVSSRRLRTRLWWVTGLCVVLALGLVASSLRTQGKLITVRFRDGYGLKPGDTLRYRGIEVGSVTQVAISPDLNGVDVKIQLVPGNERVAVEGSQFWIARAQLRLGQVSGIDTVLGAKYVGVLPGDLTAPPHSVFRGLETPLGITDGDSREIQIQFPTGEGLQVGDPVRYRGIDIGEVTLVELQTATASVLVSVRLVGTARDLARLGSQFWIERPRLDLTEIRGLETLLGGRYIAMQPSATDSPPGSTFVGLAEAPPLPRRDGSLEVELDASSRLGLVRGAPITYRGLEVGRISHVALASDGASVKFGAVIDTEYAELVRDNSKWWAIGGIELEASLSGIQVSIESMSAWVRGGVAFATPLAPGERVVTGHRFVLEAEPQTEWLQWQPRIALRGSSRSGQGLELPRPVRVVASWQASWLGLYRRRTLQTWGIALDDKSLRVPSEFIRQASLAGDEVAIEVAGKSFPLGTNAAVTKSLERAGSLFSLPLPESVQVSRWPVSDTSPQWDSQSVLLVVNPELSEPLAIDGTRLAKSNSQRINLAPGVAIAPALTGSPVVHADSGKLLGLLVLIDNQWSIGTW
jgi:paraquat-inducible protein B